MIRTLAQWLLAIALLGLAIASLLPLIESNAWWVRILDFPRMQFAALLIVLGAIWLALGGAPQRSRGWPSPRWSSPRSAITATGSGRTSRSPPR